MTRKHGILKPVFFRAALFSLYFSMAVKKLLKIFTGIMLLLITYVFLRSFRSGTASKNQVVVQFVQNNGKKAWVNEVTSTEDLSYLKRNNSERQPQTKSTTMKPATIKATTRKETTTNSATTKLTTPKPEKIVLLYTPLFDRSPWPDMKTTQDLTHYKDKPCKVTNCRLTYDKKDLAKSDAVVFHGIDMPILNTMKEISKNRNLHQRWIFFTQENPRYLFLGTQYYNNFFNWTLTYRRDSDIYAPRYHYRLLGSTESKQNLQNYAQGKDRLIALLTGFDECITLAYLKNQVISKLKLYIDVTVFGECSQMFGQTNTCGSGCGNLLRRFKFYLAFENAACTDYVTEKYWYYPFNHDMVPIVLGPPKYDSKLAIPGSYINVMDFPSLEDLASYLKYLDKNATAYNQYFQWKLKYKLEKGYPWNCKMCEMLNNPNLPVRVYDDLGTYWGEKSSCGEIEKRIKKLL